MQINPKKTKLQDKIFARLRTAVQTYQQGAASHAIIGIVLLVFTAACGPGAITRPDAEGLLHHYTFDGHGTLVFDSVGWADGLMMGRSRLNNKGAVELDGDDDYVDLPNGIISEHDNLTIELVLQRGPIEGRYSRIFSFGSSSAGEVTQAGSQGGDGETFLELTLQVEDKNLQQLGFSFDQGQEYTFNCTGVRSLSLDRVHHIVVVVEDLANRISYYLDGELNCSIENVVHSLGSIKDVNNWLGRSQWTNDHMPKISFYDLKVYGRALSVDEVRRQYDSNAWRPVQDPGE